VHRCRVWAHFRSLKMIQQFSGAVPGAAVAGSGVGAVLGVEIAVEAMVVLALPVGVVMCFDVLTLTVPSAAAVVDVVAKKAPGPVAPAAAIVEASVESLVDAFVAVVAAVLLYMAAVDAQLASAGTGPLHVELAVAAAAPVVVAWAAVVLEATEALAVAVVAAGAAVVHLPAS
jgi:hypothetical protein